MINLIALKLCLFTSSALYSTRLVWKFSAEDLLASGHPCTCALNLIIARPSSLIRLSPHHDSGAGHCNRISSKRISRTETHIHIQTHQSAQDKDDELLRHILRQRSPCQSRAISTRGVFTLRGRYVCVKRKTHTYRNKHRKRETERDSQFAKLELQTTCPLEILHVPSHRHNS